MRATVDDAMFAAHWPRQVTAFSTFGGPGLAYLTRYHVDGPVDCLVWRDSSGYVRGFLYHYPSGHPAVRACGQREHVGRPGLAGHRHRHHSPHYDRPALDDQLPAAELHDRRAQVRAALPDAWSAFRGAAPRPLANDHAMAKRPGDVPPRWWEGAAGTAGILRSTRPE